MDTDQQVRLSFLEESGEYCTQIEQVLLDLSTAEQPAQQLDIAMRAAHSLKGGAGMMGFTPMATVAHRLEDFFKILRARKIPVDAELETLLLRGVDCFKDVRQQLLSEEPLDEAWMATHAEPVFQGLRDRLGELNETDEDRLLSEEEEVDLATLVFNGGVEEALSDFEAQLPNLQGQDLRQGVVSQCDRLMDLGLMGEQDAFVSLCQSVQSQATTINVEQLPALADQALKLWRRSQSLVQLGRTAKMPIELNFVPDSTLAEIDASATALAVELALEEALDDSASQAAAEKAIPEPQSATDSVTEQPPTNAELDTSDLALLQDEMAQAAAAALGETLQSNKALEAAEATSAEVVEEPATQVIAPEELAQIQAELALPLNAVDDSKLDLTETLAPTEALTPAPKSEQKVGEVKAPTAVVPEEILSPQSLSDLEPADQSTAAPTSTAPTSTAPSSTAALELGDLSELQSAFAAIETPVIETPVLETPASPAQATSQASATAKSAPKPASSPAKAPAKAAGKKSARPARKPQLRRNSTIRVAATDLQQINDLFGTLILERNAINLRQSQLQDFTLLLQERMQALEAFNLRLRQWYDRSSMETLISGKTEGAALNQPEAALVGSPNLTVAQLLAQQLQAESQNSDGEDFDALEMDQYSDLHLMAQEQMETIVQLQEVTADIRLGLQDMGQATQALNRTTRNLQSRITRTQMRPFSDIVGGFPRVIRDLSLQYNKQVALKVEGETALFERVALDMLTDPIIHLLRNSFDHGIELEEERLAAGKPVEGTITLRASQQGNRAKIIIKDDGRGINLEKIRDRMRKHDIPEEHIAKMGEQDLLSLIFDAGFSTADKVTELSGRGVGMDVVRTNLEKINGEIQVGTEEGKGTTFTITIPLSLSVLRIILLEQQGMVFAIPVDAMEELLPYSETAVVSDEAGDSYYYWKDQKIPLNSLEPLLSFNGNNLPTPMEGKPVISHPMVTIVRHSDGYHAIPIQRFWGEQEVATRPVSSPIPLPQGFMGATILGDGRVVPLIDLPRLVAHTTVESAPSLNELLPEGAEKTPQQGNVSATPESGIAQKTVLVVDDSVHLRRYLTLTLEKAGYFVEQARDGQEAVDKLIGGLQVQAVLCDVEMPRLDGYGVLEELKGRSEFESLPISMLTSRSSEKHRKLAMNLGASAYFAKPYNDQELLKTLEELIAAAV